MTTLEKYKKCFEDCKVEILSYLWIGSHNMSCYDPNTNQLEQPISDEKYEEIKKILLTISHDQVLSETHLNNLSLNLPYMAREKSILKFVEWAIDKLEEVKTGIKKYGYP